MTQIASPAPVSAPRNYWFQLWKPSVVSTDEAWVVDRLNKVERGYAIAVADLNNVLTWTFNNFDVIAADVAQVIQVASLVGMGTNPTVVAAEGAARAVLAAIAAAKAHASGSNTNNIAVAAQAAYTAVKDLQVAHAQAAIAVATNGKK